MIERYSGNIEMVCDACGDSLGVYPSDDFDIMVAEAKRKRWRNHKVDGEWQNICPDCAP